MRQSERAIPGRYLTEDERAKAIAKFMDWYVNRRPTEEGRTLELSVQWKACLSSEHRLKWSGYAGRTKTGGGKRNGR